MGELTKMRGWAALTPEQRRAISSKGGKAAHASGKAHQFTREEAQAAGAKGGRATHAKRRRSEAEPNNAP